ncbi:hypothetical protein ACFVAF_18090 [Streptomyces sp. NPDC057596]
MPTFQARFPGECNSCGAPIDEGDSIGYVDGEIACQDCWEVNEEWNEPS